MPPDTRSHVGFAQWVGTCPSCGLRWLVYGSCVYTDGKAIGWSSDKKAICVDCFTKKPPPKYRPLPTLEEQAPFQAAYQMGGEQAVWAMLGVDQ